MDQSAPGLARVGTVAGGGDAAVQALAARAGATSDAAFGTMIRDTYLTNPIARASAVMAELSAADAQRRLGIGKSAAKTDSRATVSAHG